METKEWLLSFCIFFFFLSKETEAQELKWLKVTNLVTSQVLIHCSFSKYSPLPLGAIDMIYKFLESTGISFAPLRFHTLRVGRPQGLDDPASLWGPWKQCPLNFTLPVSTGPTPPNF